MASKSSTATDEGGGRAKPKRRRRALSQKEQSQRFIETARDVEADESGAEFERAMGRLLKPGTVQKG